MNDLANGSAAIAGASRRDSAEMLTTNRYAAGWQTALLLGIALVLGSCSQVMETSAIGYALDGQLVDPIQCRSKLGTYNLPKTYLRVQIARVGTSPPEYVLHTITPVIKPDNNRAFCLDYLASSFSDDQVKVKKSKGAAGSQFLQLVASEAIDQTSLIIRRLIRTAFIAIGNLGARKLKDNEVAAAEPLIDIEYDPFDVAQTAHVNERVREYGFCLVLESYSFNTNAASPQQYCQNPVRIARNNEKYARWYADFQTSAVRLQYPGIVYRPRTAYQLRVYTKNDPHGPERWLVRKTQPFDFENISPILSVRVDRTTFAHRKTVLMFDDGTLTDVCISKDSELDQAIEIPLDIAKAIVKLPTEIIQIQYDQIKDSNNFLEAEKRLVIAQQQLIAAMYEDTSGGSFTSPAAPSAFQKYTLPGELNSTTAFDPNFSNCTPRAKSGG